MSAIDELHSIDILETPYPQQRTGFCIVIEEQVRVETPLVLSPGVTD